MQRPVSVGKRIVREMEISWGRSRNG
jgi:hypothetical protein